ncbi:pimeloyl-ACP methyl ester carboxylesterase [Saccharothrix coeruleofusca]|uniref:alpha/beta fold hydrolase n=1 Tax=Saccharothrix coeruleofusca TaxID=33919 RepID=UPI001AE4769F|nr:alpha/beta hydrolase [Saccharothrix coeruleofusca]MBP2338102.1 pimeloyl-ACP methyl ester carboxylesterase [Saccharothrix coeruleofusca]
MPGYTTVSGVRTRHTAIGEGDPLVLPHGGFSDSRDFGPSPARLADRFRPHLPDRRCRAPASPN